MIKWLFLFAIVYLLYKSAKPFLTVFRFSNTIKQKKRKIENVKVKFFMTKNPFVIEENTLATDVLNQMNKKKITNVCVYKKGNKRKTVGVLHIHNILNNLR